MKNFKCGNCKSLYTIDETKINQPQAVFTCPKCSAKNLIKFGYRLLVVSKDSNGAEVKMQFNLKDGINLIGRKSNTPSADILLEDPYISRMHLSITVEKKDSKTYFIMEDLGSSNGTFDNNGKRLDSGKKYPLPPGTSYKIGNCNISLLT